MNDKLKLEIVTPDATHPARDVSSVQAPAELGRMTVLPGHQPCLCMIRGGRVKIVASDGAEEAWQVGKGTLTVDRDSAVLLVRSAARAEAAV